MNRSRSTSKLITNLDKNALDKKQLTKNTIKILQKNRKIQHEIKKSAFVAKISESQDDFYPNKTLVKSNDQISAPEKSNDLNQFKSSSIRHQNMPLSKKKYLFYNSKT